MNSLTLTGNVVGTPDVRSGRDGTPKAQFEISSDGGPSGELYFCCVCFGNPATAAASLKENDRVFLAGRLVTSRFGQAMSFVVSAFELLKAGEER